MYYSSLHLFNNHSANAAPVRCNWQALRRQLLDQWQRLSAPELDSAGPDCHRIALLIGKKYGVATPLVENYLHNFERTLPLATYG